VTEYALNSWSYFDIQNLRLVILYICSVCRYHDPILSSFSGFAKRVKRHAPHVEQELLILPEHLRSPPVFSVVRVARSVVFHVMLFRSLFVRLSLFFWPLCCLSFIDLRLLIIPFVSSNFSYSKRYGSLQIIFYVSTSYTSFIQFSRSIFVYNFNQFRISLFVFNLISCTLRLIA